MASDFLNQAEIDALLNQQLSQEDSAEQEIVLSDDEIDALAEVANISMGSGATVLSELVNQRVTITNPKVIMDTAQNFVTHLPAPHLAIKVEYTRGLSGSNLLVISYRDARILSQMMMGEVPDLNSPAQDDLDEIQISAASEAMNQMIASAATAMAQMFETPVDISPPDLKFFQGSGVDLDNSKLVIIMFDMQVGDDLHSHLIQMLPLEMAKEQVKLLYKTTISEEPSKTTISEEPSKTTIREEPSGDSGQKEILEQAVSFPYQGNSPKDLEPEIPDSNLELILDIPLTVSVVLGKTRKPIQDILSFQSGSIIELNRLVDENVDILVNNVLVAKGEVVVINDSFGVRITNILSQKERILQLKNGVA